MDSTVGYTGGSTTAAPTYQSVCAGDGHTEAIKLEYDTSVTSFEEIITHFFEDPHVENQFCSDDSGGGRSAMEPKQYRTAIWAQDETQRDIALKVSASVGKEVPVLPQSEWYDAEAYHQHWMDPDARPNHWKTTKPPSPKAWSVPYDPWASHGSLDADVP